MVGVHRGQPMREIGAPSLAELINMAAKAPQPPARRPV
jgi:hypothetical protein